TFFHARLQVDWCSGRLRNRVGITFGKVVSAARVKGVISQVATQHVPYPGTSSVIGCRCETVRVWAYGRATNSAVFPAVYVILKVVFAIDVLVIQRLATGGHAF